MHSNALATSDWITSKICDGIFKKQEAHGPRLTHMSDIATADIQMLCNIFLVLYLQLMKGSSFKQFLVLKKNIWG